MAFQWLFLSPEWLGAFFLTSLPVADNVHKSRAQCSEVVSYTNYGLHAADVAATRILLLQNYSRPRRKQSGGVECSAVECSVWCAVCGVWCVVCGVQSAECRVQSAECRVQSVVCSV